MSIYDLPAVKVNGVNKRISHSNENFSIAFSIYSGNDGINLMELVFDIQNQIVTEIKYSQQEIYKLTGISKRDS